MKFIKKNYRVNIVAIKDGWILEKMARHLADNLPYINWTELPSKKETITYYINYAQAAEKKASAIEIASFTHIEERDPVLVKKWHCVARNTDIAVCMSEIYAKKFKNYEAPAIVIPPGVDIDSFTLKPINIGVVGSVKHSGRKGEDLIRKVIDIEGLRFHFTNDTNMATNWPGTSTHLKDEDMPNFYQQMDYILVTSYYEGGPMCIIEALASGVPVIAPPVGWAPELPHISFKLGDVNSLRRVLTGLAGEKNKLRSSILTRTWGNYIEKHDKLFKGLLENNHIDNSLKIFNR